MLLNIEYEVLKFFTHPHTINEAKLHFKSSRKFKFTNKEKITEQICYFLTGNKYITEVMGENIYLYEYGSEFTPVNTNIPINEQYYFISKQGRLELENFEGRIRYQIATIIFSAFAAFGAVLSSIMAVVALLK